MIWCGPGSGAELVTLVVSGARKRVKGARGACWEIFELSSDLGWFLVAIMSLCGVVAKCGCAEVATDQI